MAIAQTPIELTEPPPPPQPPSVSALLRGAEATTRGAWMEAPSG